MGQDLRRKENEGKEVLGNSKDQMSHFGEAIEVKGSV